MNLSCDIIMDLAPIYHDGTAGKASVAAVEEHLRECPDCRRFYRNFKTMLGNQKTPLSPPESEAVMDFGRIASRLRLRRLLIAAVIAAYSCALAGLLIHRFIKDYKRK
ncbi:MAG: zf-HC2 domain-containing protein [Clostridiales bacterium]|nr:zf-HC2 domain-containing protein [Clostridiales bacterium]